MQTRATIEFNNCIRSIAPDTILRSQQLAYAFGFLLGQRGSIPTAEVESSSLYYVEQVEVLVRKELSEFSNLAAFDVFLALEFAKSIWKLRYNTVHRPATDFVPPFAYGFFDTMMSVDRYISIETHGFVNEHKETIFKLVRYLDETLYKKQNTGD